ncbi:MAG TPA: sigma-70 family RNA polymerase sigma factor [Candidatus Lustribacter sp.]|nr:sigma-70 family RNA polymerase sigma factor [Candidatus Lustribacter sp.]
MNEDREEAIRRLVPLVRRIARRIVRLVPGADLDDLIGDGCVGVIRAVDAFDPTLGPSLEQYARRVALGAMLNGIRRLDPVSERVRRVIRLAERERYALAVERGALPSDADLAAHFPTLARARTDAHRGSPLSLDAPLPPASGCAPSGGEDPAEAVIARGERVRVRAAIAALPHRQRAVVVAHYFAERPLRALSDDMHVSPQRVSQLHIAAIERMRRSLA